MKLVTATFTVIALATAANATDRFFSDIHVRSASGRFEVHATSPDNKGGRHRPFQSQFTYKCLDTSNKKTIWTRAQPMVGPLDLDKDSEPDLWLPDEGSPVAIFVSDRGSTVIRTAWDNLIVVSHQGEEVGKVDLLKGALTEAENKQFVRNTTAGPYWTGLSVWYYLQIPERELFVMRPWWGRRIFVDIGEAKVASTNGSLIEAAAETERQLVIAALSSTEEPNDNELSRGGAAYLAGVLHIQQAIPFLKAAEESTYFGSYTAGGLSAGRDYNNEVDPHRYRTYSLRQVAQLSLRRLGVAPRPLPCHTFELMKHGTSKPFVPTTRERPRHESVQEVKVGMSAKQVLNLIGSPDFIDFDTWSYDMDADTPFSVTLTFDARKVTGIKREAPLWKSGLSRDEALAY
jgi:hypothetical protein